jgi:tripartite-type tricarboxylate transporter receptor subunit TctC
MRAALGANDQPSTNRKEFLIMSSLRRLAISLATVAAVATPAAAQEFYEGQTITCVVPYAPGGGTDAFFRVVVPHLARLIPGQPDIIINNMDGSGGLRANNYASDGMPNDGSEMLCAPWLSVAQVTQSEGVRFDYSTMRVVGGESSINTAVINADTMIDGDRSTVGQGEQSLILAGLSPNSTLDLRQRLAYDILEMDYLYVPGYRGSAVQVPAFLSGEVSIIGMNYGTYAAAMKSALVDQGPGMLFVEFPGYDADGNPVPSDIMVDLGVPTIQELYEQMHGSAFPTDTMEARALQLVEGLSSMGLSIWLPEGAPDEALEALRAGWEALPNDPEFIAAHEEAFGKPVSFVSYEQALAAQQSVAGVDPAMVNFLLDFIAAGAE